MKIDLFSIGPFTIHGYGLMIGLGFMIAVVFCGYRTKKLGLSEDHFTNLAICLLVFGFMGGKLLYILVNIKQFFKTPLQLLGSEGFVVYGGIIVGILSVFIYCKIKKISFLSYMDMMSMAVVITQGFGRIGCFMAGCCYGRHTDSWFGVVFPEGCLAPAGVRLVPTQLLSAAFDLAVGVFLIAITRRVKYRGAVSGYYLMLYGVGRFIIEFFRGDAERGSIGGLSTSQFISIFMIIFAAGYLYVVYKKKIPTEYVSLKTETIL
ncbi:MAG: prolipoprotein diacylglyceryl transferase [Lachnospiraceae bacterium]|nr:prolipoprotein diacylglyceryl transferase [Lachnospiraceae bacterium]